jgi:glutamate---cysteine ligase / carboxylate-amine ligase
VRTVGVEEEFLLVDGDGHLCERSEDVLRASEEPQGEFAAELTRGQIESSTGVCESMAAALSQLSTLRTELAASAADRGMRLLPSGCPIMPEDGQPEITGTPRYRRLGERFGGLARQLPTCGCHVHVAMPDRELGVAVIDHARPWLPVLLAMSANSPFAGYDTGYASWRYQAWGRWPSAGPPPRFGSLDAYESIVDAMLRSGAILDEGMVYWDIRLSAHQPTLEFRVADVCATAGEAALLATLVRGLVASCADRAGSPVADLPDPVLRANLWQASRSGLAGTSLHPATGAPTPFARQLGDLLALVSPALDDDRELAATGVAKLLAEGSGADRQRAAFARRRRLTDVVTDLTAVP